MRISTAFFLLAGLCAAYEAFELHSWLAAAVSLMAFGAAVKEWEGY